MGIPFSSIIVNRMYTSPQYSLRQIFCQIMSKLGSSKYCLICYVSKLIIIIKVILSQNFLCFFFISYHITNIYLYKFYEISHIDFCSIHCKQFMVMSCDRNIRFFINSKIKFSSFIKIPYLPLMENKLFKY
jgi:hypothetical protein